MREIFISYRKQDSQDVTDHIYYRLTLRYGERRVFRDVKDLVGGLPFEDGLEQALGSCGVCLVIIGPNWSTIQDEEGHRRLDEEDDWVRTEVEVPLRRGIPVIPVLVGGATFPRKAELPESLRPLCKRQYRQIRPDPDFDRDMERLTHDIDMHLRPGCNPWQAVVRPSPKPPEDAGAPGKTTARPWRIGPWTTWDVAVVAAVAAGLMLIATMLAAGARQTPPPVSPSLAGEYYEMGAAFHRSAIDYEQAGMRTNMLGAYGRAASAYREAIHIQPYNGACHWNLAICLEKMGETEEAQWHWDFCAKYLGWPRGRPGCNAPPNFEQDPTTWSPPP